MEAIFSLRFGNSSRIINQVSVCGIPSSAEPLFESGEVNIHLKGRDTHVRSFHCFLVHKLKEGAIVAWKFGRNHNTSK